jgi:hypothetical protein
MTLSTDAGFQGLPRRALSVAMCLWDGLPNRSWRTRGGAGGRRLLETKTFASFTGAESPALWRIMWHLRQSHSTSSGLE